MDGQHSDGVAGAQHRADIMGIVNILEDDGQIGLAVTEDVRDAFGSATGPGELARLAWVGWQRLPIRRSHQSWHHTRMNDVSCMRAIPA